MKLSPWHAMFFNMEGLQRHVEGVHKGTIAIFEFTELTCFWEWSFPPKSECFDIYNTNTSSVLCTFTVCAACLLAASASCLTCSTVRFVAGIATVIVRYAASCGDSVASWYSLWSLLQLTPFILWIRLPVKCKTTKVNLTCLWWPALDLVVGKSPQAGKKVG